MTGNAHALLGGTNSRGDEVRERSEARGCDRADRRLNKLPSALCLDDQGGHDILYERSKECGIRAIYVCDAVISYSYTVHRAWYNYNRRS